MFNTQYHIGDTVIYVDSQFQPQVAEVIDIDAQRYKEGLKTQFLLSNGHHYPASDLFPDMAAAKTFYGKHFEKLLSRFDETALTTE